MKATEQTQMLVNGIKDKQTDLRNTMELIILRDLVKKLDPDHEYSFDAETMTFSKTKIVKEEPDGS